MKTINLEEFLYRIAGKLCKAQFLQGVNFAAHKKKYLRLINVRTANQSAHSYGSFLLIFSQLLCCERNFHFTSLYTSISTMAPPINHLLNV